MSCFTYLSGLFTYTFPLVLVNVFYPQMRISSLFVIRRNQSPVNVTSVAFLFSYLTFLAICMASWEKQLYLSGDAHARRPLHKIHGVLVFFFVFYVSCWNIRFRAICHFWPSTSASSGENLSNRVHLFRQL